MIENDYLFLKNIEILLKHTKKIKQINVRASPSSYNHQNKTDKPDPFLQEKVTQIESGEDDRISFFIEKGRKYYKVCLRWKQINRQFKDDISVHCFVDKLTGEVYKPAGWKKPAKHVRFNMSDDVNRAKLYNVCDWAGGYLYLR